MARESEWSCPICCDNQDDVAYMSPCLHQFCLGCALRWARQKPNCSLCRSEATAILFSVWSDDDYLMFDIPGPADPLADDPQDEQRATGPVPEAEVDSFPPKLWADFFKSHPNNVRPLLPWLWRELEVLAEDQWWEVAGAEGTIVAHLCLCGLDEEALVRHLQNSLTEHTMTFIRQLIAVAMRLCGREIRQHLGQWDPHAAGEEEEDDNDDPEPSPSPISSRGGTPSPDLRPTSSPAGSDEEEETGRLEATLRGGFGHPSSAPIPIEPEQPQKQPGEVAAAPSAQGYSCCCPAPSWGRGCLPRRPRHPPERRAPSTQNSSRPCKRPPHRRH
ncbi:hypothetical protein GRJ2_003049600 [Grus japonensis]|uniref:RING-type E3 ubiquitin transferase n=1 Tax=Grus japonensis TaxID=30415 RepID=A0ABC9Y6Z4_GRUJA